MFVLSAWQPTQEFRPGDPRQRTRAIYLPNAGEYRSVYWNSIDPQSSILNGLGDGTELSTLAKVSLAAAAGLGALWAYRKAKGKKGLGLFGPRRRRKRR